MIATAAAAVAAPAAAAATATIAAVKPAPAFGPRAAFGAALAAVAAVAAAGGGLGWRLLPHAGPGKGSEGRRGKSHLPVKTCPVCQRPFEWRKKWAAVWDDVKYCSERCRRRKGDAAPDANAICLSS
eukprot:SM000117S25532  [mRNA]  locus=s117:430957:431593:- [translate_table: standard]